jgi:hypothetical protein
LFHGQELSAVVFRAAICVLTGERSRLKQGLGLLNVVRLIRNGDDPDAARKEDR